jgi:hypothetical protein
MMGDLTPLFAATAPTLIAWRDDQLRAENERLREENKSLRIEAKRAAVLQGLFMDLGKEQFHVSGRGDHVIQSCRACGNNYYEQVYAFVECSMCGVTDVCLPCLASHPSGAFPMTYIVKNYATEDHVTHTYYETWCADHKPE